MPNTEGTRLSVYCGPFDGGSTAKIAARLANGFAARGIPTDLLVTASRSPIPETTDPGVRVVSMGSMGALIRVPAMALYLLRNRPGAVLTHRIRENVFALKAARLAGTGTPIFVTVHGRMSVKLDHIPGNKGRRRRAEFQHWYRRNRGIVAISEDTAADLRGLLGPDAPIAAIPNPIVTREMSIQAQSPADHPWLAEPKGRRAIPVLVFAGRLEVEKDLPTLLRAFARLCAHRICRLLIVGDGRLRPEIERERAALNLEDRVDMPGWVVNPYPYLRLADLVVLSSVWDALPTVLIESLALGTPVVSTECGAGPREILDGGRYGPLIPPRDPEALADAMERTLADPLPPETLRAGGERYDAQRNADLYLRLMLGAGSQAAMSAQTKSNRRL